MAALVLRIGGPRLAYAVFKGLGLPGLSTVYARMDCPELCPSIRFPTLLEVTKNVSSMFREVTGSTSTSTSPSPSRRRLHSILIDEVALERRPRYFAAEDAVVGICREHSQSLDLTQISHRGLPALEAIHAALESGSCHRAREATVVAIAGFSPTPNEFGARPVLVSGTCKAESERDGARLVQTVLQARRDSPQGEALHGPIISLATDGDPTRRRAFYSYCMTQELSRSSALFELLGDLPLLNICCGPDEVTHDGDFKHEEKRFAAALRTRDGILVAGTLINSSLIKQNLCLLPDISPATAAQLLDPTDHQNVPKANHLLNLIWRASCLPAVRASPAQRAFVLLGQLFHAFTQPFTNPVLDLAAQLTLLSTCGHLLFALYRCNGGAFIPGQLYYDVQSTIKNAFFVVAKSQLFDPSGPVYLLQCGTDRLEKLFSIFRTLSHDRNMDLIQLVERAAHVMHLDEIFTRNPDLDKGSYRLTLDGSAGIDHTNPTAFTGNLVATSVGLRTAWTAGAQRAAKLLDWAGVNYSFDVEQLGQTVSSTEGSSEVASIDLMRPFGSYVGIQVDTIDITLPRLTESQSNSTNPADETETLLAPQSDAAIELEDILPPVHPVPSNSGGAKRGWIDVEGKPVHAESLVRCCLGLDEGPKSTDRLRRVIGMTRSPHRPSLRDNRILGTDFILGQLVLSFISIQNTPAAAIIRVTSITKSNGDVLEGLAHSELQDSSITLGGQVLTLNIDSDTNTWVWNVNSPWESLPKAGNNTSSQASKQSSIVRFGAMLALPVNPAAHDQPNGIWAFDDKALSLLVAQHWASIIEFQKHIPSRSGTKTFPYRGINGMSVFSTCLPCIYPTDLSLDEPRFLQEATEVIDTAVNRGTLKPCFLCQKQIPLGKMRTHVAVHILARCYGIPDPAVLFPDLVRLRILSRR